MQPLNLPDFEIRIDGQAVFCLIRKKWITLTPEEWVRQHFLNLMVQHLHYPKGMIRLEHSHSYFKNAKRSDIVLLDRSSGIFMAIECKAVSVKIDQKVINQISQYNKILKAKYIAITNGLSHFIWHNKLDAYEQLSQFPPYL